ncbi:regulator of chromosome condensation 1/beta-lactamase-inhibitor protein II [Scheffersomyces xylosifermentans]|uniref:regulator of chromosome condensation 1/beta-lactamase-inhibitor protein II n=1 Tax=Scheffersomyces xylosifermentans TaxID=1304137 RepID=UPI00315D65F1
MLNLLDLGDDILVSILPQFLSPQDIFSVSTLNKSLYDLYYNSSLSSALYQQLYNKLFTNNDNNFTLTDRDKLNWKQLFNLRCSPKQQVYTWGSSQFGRLGYLIDRIDRSHVASSNFGYRGVHTPTNVPQFDNHIITDIVASGFQFVVLSSSGQIVTTGVADTPGTIRESTPGPIGDRDYHELRLSSSEMPFSDNVGSRRSIRRVGIMPMPGSRYEHDVVQTQPIRTPRETPVNPNLRLPPEELAFPPALTEPPIADTVTSTESSTTAKATRNPIQDSNFLTTVKFPDCQDDAFPISISCGRQHYIVLDNKNRITTWDSGCRDNSGVILSFPGIDRKLPVVKICAGWNLSSCYIYEVGIVVWYSRTPITKDQFEAGNLVSEAHYLVIPFTKRDVVDFTVGSDFVLFIKKSDKKLYKFSMNAHSLATRQTEVQNDELTMAIQPVACFNNWLVESNIQNGSTTQFTRLNCCYTNFVVFTNDDGILIGGKTHLDADDDGFENNGEVKAVPKILPELQKKNIKTVEIGDYHFLALTNDGNILSWGLESNNCGCLGLGSKEDVVMSHNSNEARDPGHNSGMEVLVPLKVKNPPFAGKWVSIAASGWHSAGVYVAD